MLETPKERAKKVVHGWSSYWAGNPMTEALGRLEVMISNAITDAMREANDNAIYRAVELLKKEGIVE